MFTKLKMFLMCLKGQSGVSSISGSSVPCGLGSIITLSSSETCKGMTEPLSLVAFAVRRWLLNYAGEFVMYWMPRHTRPFWEKWTSMLSLEAALISVAVLHCSPIPQTECCTSLPQQHLDHFCHPRFYVGWKTWCMLMTVRELQLTQIHSNSHTHTKVEGALSCCIFAVLNGTERVENSVS